MRQGNWKGQSENEMTVTDHVATFPTWKPDPASAHSYVLDSQLPGSDSQPKTSKLTQIPSATSKWSIWNLWDRKMGHKNPYAVHKLV